MSEIQNVNVIGAGSYGTSLALHIARKGYPVKIWAYEKEVVDDINNNHINSLFLPNFKLPENLQATSDLAECVSQADMIISVMPTPHIAGIMEQIVPHLKKYIPIVSCSKGIENSSLEIPSEIIERVIPEEYHYYLCFLSGPSFAKEVAAGLPTAVSLASKNMRLANRVQKVISDKKFRVYTTNDIVGVEFCGALKNVVAIAAGASDGLGYGFNTRAALITRGLNEITRIATKKGANPLTMLGLAGMGDLVLTCTGELSRNRTVGFKIGQGEKLEDILNSMRMVAEGVLTSQSAYQLSQKLHIENPIIEQIYHVLHEGRSPGQAVEELMTRELKTETE